MRGLVAEPLGQLTVLSFTTMTPLLRAPQYPTTRTSFWLHSPLHAAATQSTRITRIASSATPGGPGGPSGPWGPGGPGGPAGPASPFSPAAPTAPGSPFGLSRPATQMESAIATATLLTCMHVSFVSGDAPSLGCWFLDVRTRHTRADGTRQEDFGRATAGRLPSFLPRATPVPLCYR
jgi:hypothetical protein